MDEQLFFKIIEDEQLSGFNWYNQSNLIPNQVGIMLVDGVWKTFAVTERNSIMTDSIFEYDNEGDALDDLIFRLRADKRIRERQNSKKE